MDISSAVNPTRNPFTAILPCYAGEGR